MLDLVFFTTNKTKINHFRYLARGLGISVKSFKELNYYASYDEPRIDDRQQLLYLSYISALKQWQKRQGKAEEAGSTFFFEDTSVMINALSTDKEFPGVNVKFWMRETTFENLDAQLKALGNDRRVTVRSDIVMHLPKRWKDALKMEEDYVWVYGTVSGTIVEKSEQIDLNLMYPWLDDKSFNRWFVPDGADGPISSLPIESADLFDFRSRAFEKMLDILRKLNFLHESNESKSFQLSLPKVEEVPTVLVICGPSCAGKTTLASWLTDKYDIPHIEASDFMYRAFWERHGLGSNVKISDFAQLALKSQPDIVSSQIIAHIRRKNIHHAVVTGFRSPEEIECFNAELSSETRCEVVYLDAASSVRLDRAIKRNRDNISEEKFWRRESQEVEMGLEIIRDELADVKVFNDVELKVLFSIFKKNYRVFLNIFQHASRRIRFDSNLEPLIIMSMVDFVNSGKWLTTTEITSAVNKKFDQKKFKDNISRYFNQTYHPYYDARLRENGLGGSKVIEYMLSTTGISEAKLLAKFDKMLLIKRPDAPRTLGVQLPLFE